MMTISWWEENWQAGSKERRGGEGLERDDKEEEGKEKENSMDRQVCWKRTILK